MLDETYTSRSTSLLDRGAEERVVEGGVASSSVYGSLWKLAIPPTIAARCTMRSQPASARARLVGVAQVAGVDLGSLAHPLRRRALVGDAHAPRRRASSRRTTAVPIVPAPPVTRTAPELRRLPGASAAPRSATRPVSTGANTRAAPNEFHGSTTSAPGAPSATVAQRRGLGELGVVGGDHDRGRAVAPRPRASRVAAAARAGRAWRPRPARAPAGGSASPTASRAGRRSRA